MIEYSWKPLLAAAAVVVVEVGLELGTENKEIRPLPADNSDGQTTTSNN